MFIKRLWLQNKVLCVFIILLSAFQLLNNARQDVAFSPVYTYGMYSRAIHPAGNFSISAIIVNGKPLQTKNFTPQQWDNIMQPVLLFSEQDSWNRLQFNNYINRLLHISDSSYYLNHLSQTQFNNWYKSYLATIIHSDISTLSIQTEEYKLVSGKPVAVRLLQSLSIP